MGMSRWIVISDQHGDALNTIAKAKKQGLGACAESILEQDPTFLEELRKNAK